MLLASFILFAALSRAELIDRFRAPHILQVDGLVQVRAECDAAMRREYQLPVAGFAAEICRQLYHADNLRERHFASPGIVIVIGDVTTNLTNVVSRVIKREGGVMETKILVPAPGYADRRALGLAVVQGYYRAVRNADIDMETAVLRYREAVPELKLADQYRALEEWYAGKRGKEDDEVYLKLQRSVLQPGVANPHDVEIFASRLYLYPPYYNAPFCGKYECLSFRDAVPLARKDPRIRYAAYQKIQEVILFSGGHGEKLAAAGQAYAAFLRDLLASVKPEAELLAGLDAADAILKGVLE